MSKEKNKDNTDNFIDEEKREHIIEIMKALRDKRETEIFESELDVSIIDIQYLGTINWLDERDDGDSEKEKDVFVIIEERKGEVLYRYYDDDLEILAVQLPNKDEILPSEKYTFKKDKDFLEDIKELDEKESLKKIEEEERLSEEKEQEEISRQQKPQNVIQYIDVDKVYVDDKTTFRQAYGIPKGVEELAIRPTNSKDENPLSSNLTMDMVDRKGNAIEKVKVGEKEITINDLFKVDDATGNNPAYDDNTKLELDKTAEKNKNQTMGRFESRINNSLYLSVEQKKVGDYPEIYSGRKTKDGNNPVEIQLETRNEPIQTSFEIQKINRKARGEYSADAIDQEADFHAEHGDNTDKIAIANADGREDTQEACEYTTLSYEEAKQLALRCGYRGSELEYGIEKVTNEFELKREDTSNNEKTNEQIMDEMVDERQSEYGEIDKDVPHP